jgi:CSLREA domain-containing protein
MSQAVPELAVSAGDLHVTKTEDTLDGSCDNDCSLREAVVAANASPGADTIELPAGIYNLTIDGLDDTGSAGDLDATEDLTITGAGREQTIIDGGSADRIIEATAALSLEGITVRNGQAVASGGGGVRASGTSLSINDSRFTANAGNPGGGVWFSGATLTVEGSEFQGNNGGDFGGGIAYTGLPGPATIRDSVITGNDADGGGGGIFSSAVDLTIENSRVTENHTRHNGGAIKAGGGRLRIVDSEISGNSATGVSSDGLGGAIFYCCQDIALTILRSTLSENEAFLIGGALYLCCGGTGVTREITSSTLSGNTAGMRGGAIETALAMQFAGSTIVGNSAPETGGISISAKVAKFKNTIVAGNSGGDCNGTPSFLNSLGYNLSSDGSCNFVAKGDIGNTEPNAGPLADNGGPTRTHSLGPGSPAIDGGNPGGCTDFKNNPLTTDQRALERVRDGDGDGDSVCDIGAFELQDPAPTASPTPLPSPALTSPTPSSPGVLAATGRPEVAGLPATGGAATGKDRRDCR